MLKSTMIILRIIANLQQYSSSKTVIHMQYIIIIEYKKTQISYIDDDYRLVALIGTIYRQVYIHICTYTIVIGKQITANISLHTDSIQIRFDIWVLQRWLVVGLVGWLWLTWLLTLTKDTHWPTYRSRSRLYMDTYIYIDIDDKLRYVQ